MKLPDPRTVGARLALDRSGRGGPRLVLLHAIGLDRTSWAEVRRGLEDDATVVVPDLPGHGDSEKPEGADFGPWSLGGRVVALLDELGWDDAVLVGNSLGGGTALAAAIQAPERIRALAMVNPVAYPEGLPLLGRLALTPGIPAVARLAPRPLVRIGLEAARGRRGTARPELCDRATRNLRDPEGRQAFFAALRALYGEDLHHMQEHYPRIPHPSLVLHGTRDPLIRSGHAKRLATALPAGRLLLLHGCGHFAHEEGPEEVTAALREFVHGQEC